MPVTAINKNGHTLSGENHIGPAAEGWQSTNVLAEPEAPAMQERSKL